MRRIFIQSRLIPLNLHVVVGDGNRYARWLNARRTGEPYTPGGSGSATVYERRGGGWECAIWMPYFRKGNAFDAGTLAHEAVHVAWRLLEHLGSGDEEMHCYMVQFIVEEATTRLIRSKVVS